MSLILFKYADPIFKLEQLLARSSDAALSESIRIMATFSVILFSRFSLVWLNNNELVLKAIKIMHTTLIYT